MGGPALAVPGGDPAAGGRAPVFAVPGVGGNVLCYNDLARFMAPEQPLYGLQSRGLDGDEEPLTRIEDIAAGFLKEIRELQPEGPYYLAGMCMGGVVAYEMAQQLRAAQQEIGLLILLETWPPVGTWGRLLRPGARLLTVLRLIRSRLRLYAQTLARLEGRQRMKFLLGRLRMLGQMVAQRDVFRGDRSEFYQDVVNQADLIAYQEYEPRPYAGRVVFFRAEGRRVTAHQDRRLAWRQLITGDLDVQTVPGDDSGLMLAEPHVQVLLASSRPASSARPARSGLPHADRRLARPPSRRERPQARGVPLNFRSRPSPRRHPPRRSGGSTGRVIVGCSPQSGHFGSRRSLHLAEAHAERVVGQQPPDQRLADAEQQLDGLRRLHHPDDAWEHAQDAGLASGRGRGPAAAASGRGSGSTGPWFGASTVAMPSNWKIEPWMLACPRGSRRR